MDFTREPIIETVITARDGYRIVLRSSKNPGQEEFFVDALEVVAFHNTCFYRCLERPRAFIVPASDYEVLEVREPRLPLKTPSIEGIAKIGAGGQAGKFEGLQYQSPRSYTPHSHKAIDKEPQKETQESAAPVHTGRRETKEFLRGELQKEHSGEKKEKVVSVDGNGKRETLVLQNTVSAQNLTPENTESQAALVPDALGEPNASDTAYNNSSDRRRDRRRNLRRRKGSMRLDSVREGEEAEDASIKNETNIPDGTLKSEDAPVLSQPEENNQKRPRVRKPENIALNAPSVFQDQDEAQATTSTLITSILPAPTTLIRDELARMRNNELYKGAFYIREEEKNVVPTPSITNTETSGLIEETNEQLEENNNLIFASSLQFDDDDDLQSNAYIATPVIAPKKASSLEDGETTS